MNLREIIAIVQTKIDDVRLFHLNECGAELEVPVLANQF
jgi:hypothetical protein